MPMYLQVAALLRQDIMTGKYAQGVSLPAEQSLAGAYGVSQATVRSALAVLREEGLVITRKSAGSTVGPVPPRITVTAGPDDMVTARMPTRAEQRALGLAEGVPVISVRRPGRDEEIFDAGRAQVVFRP